MSNAIPESLGSTVAAIKEVCSELKESGELHPIGPDQWMCELDGIADDTVRHVALILDAGWPLLAIYVALELPEAGERAYALSETVTRANYGLLPGCFEFDFESGETRYRCILSLHSGKVTAKDVAQLISEALRMTQTYMPAFQKVAETGMDPEGAIGEIESQSPD